MQRQFRRFYEYLIVKDVERLCKIFNVPYELFVSDSRIQSFSVGEHEAYLTKEVISFLLNTFYKTA